MTKRPWGATGVAPVLSIAKLSNEQRENILGVFKDDIHLNDPDTFLTGVERAIHRRRAANELARSSSPGAVRNNLRLAHEAAQALCERIAALDGNSLQLLHQAAPEVDPLATPAQIAEGSFLSKAHAIKVALSKALAAACEYPERGRLPEYQNQFLAADLRALFEKHTGKLATTVYGNTFMTFLAAVMSIATKKNVSDLHSLAEVVVRNQIRTEGPDGSIEYVPFVRINEPKNP